MNLCFPLVCVDLYECHLAAMVETARSKRRPTTPGGNFQNYPPRRASEIVTKPTKSSNGVCLMWCCLMLFSTVFVMVCFVCFARLIACLLVYFCFCFEFLPPSAALSRLLRRLRAAPEATLSRMVQLG